jgi:hypothetical protein
MHDNGRSQAGDKENPSPTPRRRLERLPRLRLRQLHREQERSDVGDDEQDKGEAPEPVHRWHGVPGFGPVLKPLVEAMPPACPRGETLPRQSVGARVREPELLELVCDRVAVENLA